VRLGGEITCKSGEEFLADSVGFGREIRLGGVDNGESDWRDGQFCEGLAAPSDAG
jgi:hypothetical protein